MKIAMIQRCDWQCVSSTKKDPAWRRVFFCSTPAFELERADDDRGAPIIGRLGIMHECGAVSRDQSSLMHDWISLIVEQRVLSHD